MFFSSTIGGRLAGRGPAPARLPALPLAVASAAAARDVLGKPKPREKMPAILVASKMKSGLPKPVHSAAPILHVPPARTGPQPCYLKLGSKVEVSKTAYTSQIPLKSQGLQEPTGEGLPLRKSSSLENGFDTQIYTDWANHYLAKSGHKRLIKDLQQDVTDGVLLAQIIQVVGKFTFPFEG